MAAAKTLAWSDVPPMRRQCEIQWAGHFTDEDVPVVAFVIDPRAEDGVLRYGKYVCAECAKRYDKYIYSRVIH